eukprot:CAMPEP_0172876232 /NCGR_PEP_ID=MMETSP1075-20121228/103801_1 /TAXON_ID=2916 /ORGANISM="Ceratium fusus, Strain PA161109" /LENGTH=83 /DNA_ID=CAMNT_0013727509 /DNA_START=31 /DNA_END=280 /DNA_ORIENTATION=+
MSMQDMVNACQSLNAVQSRPQMSQLSSSTSSRHASVALWTSCLAAAASLSLSTDAAANSRLILRTSFWFNARSARSRLARRRA